MPLWLLLLAVGGVGFWAWKSGHLSGLPGLPQPPALPPGPAPVGKATVYTLTPSMSGQTVNMHVGDQAFLQVPNDPTGQTSWSATTPPPTIFSATGYQTTTDANGNQINQLTLTAVGKGTWQLSSTMQDASGSPVGGSVQFTFVVS